MKFFFINLLLFVSANIFARQKLSQDDSLLIGTWKGTSICQVRPSGCHDEINVFHVTKGKKPGIYHIVINKIVNEKEEDMAVDDYSFDSVKKELICVNEEYKIKVSLTVKADKMEGTLVLLSDPNKVFRIIKLSKLSNR